MFSRKEILEKMKEIRILYLYPDMLELYGDYGNLQVLRYRMEKRNIQVIIDRYSIGDPKPNFLSYDLIFAGGGADNEQSILAKDLLQYKEEIQEAVNQNVFFLLICGAYQLFGKYYKGVEGNIIPGLEIFDYYTEASTDRTKRCIGNIVIEAKIGEKRTKVIGFENHGGQTHGITTPFGRVLFGNGNQFGDMQEGFFLPHVIATYLHGPLLAKNPEIADYLISTCLTRKYQEKIELTKLNDELEEKCRQQLLARFVPVEKQ